MKELIDAGKLDGPPVPYVTNTLTIMVPMGNPAHVTGLADLGRAEAGVTCSPRRCFRSRRVARSPMVDIPAKDNATGIYAGAMGKSVAHLTAAKAWLAFITSPTAIKIFEGYGFKAYEDGSDEK